MGIKLRGRYICMPNQMRLLLVTSWHTYDISDQSLWAEFLERTLDELAKPLDGVAARVKLTAFGNDGGLVLCQESLQYQPSPILAMSSKLTPSKVSTKAPSIRKLRERMLMRVELSLSVKRTVVMAESGPFTTASAAACGRYVKTNMKVMTPTERVMVGTIFFIRGFHNSLWLKK